MIQITQETLDKSYTILALLDVCAIAAKYVSDGEEPKGTARISGNLSGVLCHIGELAGQVHDALEQAERESEGQS